MEQNPPLSKGKKALFTLMVLALLWGGAEVAWGAYARARLAQFVEEKNLANQFYVSDPHLQHRLKPGDWKNANNAQDTCVFHVNSHGLRGPEIADKKPESNYRILCLGGSTTFGTSCLADSLTYPAQLERALQPHFPQRKIEVLNAGVPRYLTVDSYFNLRRLASLEPDLVIVMHAINDIAFAEELGEFYHSPLSVPRPLDREMRYTLDAQTSLFSAIARRALGSAKGKIDTARQEIDPKVRPSFASHLKRIAETARNQGAQVCFLTFETQLRSDAGSEERKRVEGDALFSVCRLPYAALCQELANFNQEIRAQSKSLSVPVIELEDKIGTQTEFWGDPIHLNARGTQLMVERILPAVRALVASDLGQSP